MFAHGFGVTAEDHYGVCMQLASCGYMVASLTFYDGTAPAAHNKEDVNVEHKILNGGVFVGEDGFPHPGTISDFFERYKMRKEHS